jgi:hypothetical protein
MIGGNRQRLWFLVGLFAALWGCHRTPEVTVTDLVKNASGHDGKMVTVRGCYHNERESVALESCTQPRLEETVQILPYSQIENTAKSVPGYHGNMMRLERPSAQEQRLASQLAEMPNGVSAEVLLRGEFRFFSVSEFGHPPTHKYQLVVHRVLRVSSR